MIRTTRRCRFRRWLATSLTLGLGLSLVPAAVLQSRAAQMTSTVKLDAQELDHPILLDQNGLTIRFPTQPQSGAVSLTDGALPTYVAYPIDNPSSLSKGFPTVDSGSATSSDKTGTGPLRLDTTVKTQLDQTLTNDGQAAVYNGQNTYLVKPLPPLFGTTSTAGETTLAWIATQRSGTTQTSEPAPPTTVEAQTIIPASVTDAISNSKLVKDLENLFAIKSGKLVNWNQQTLNALESDLKISSPKNVAPKELADTSKPDLAAQVIAGAGSGGTPQPAPVPEPSTLAVFGLVAAALAVRQMKAGRK